ncbi:MAG TPA: transporter substrate-binding domain-containing protein [Paucimonas sp.]|nr:transporter substrate-binding domain-containing protein [Paucimonas sp.]
MSKPRGLLSALSLSLALAAGPAGAEQPAVKLCYDDAPLYPWRTADGRGLDFALLDLAQKRAGVHFVLTALPWKRCLSEVQQGKQDGAVAASFKNERMEIGVYPMVGDNPDPKRRMRTESYSLFRVKGSNVHWDGKTIHGASGPVGVQLGYSIADQLKASGSAVEEGTARGADIFRKMLLGRVSGAALLTQEGDYLLRDPEFKARIERFPFPLAEKPYYLLFSKQFFAGSEPLARKIWDALAAARDSAEFKKTEAAFE